ncbi:MAG: hypothetical protein C0592_05695 [Marinilabiliales bacterium]|nr:MAG: hypothetical protein C0592_05695 [Marinilabiliales bacterium]
MKDLALLILVLVFSVQISAQNKTAKALFLGNSYTGVNSLPSLTSQIASSAGDSLIFDSNTPGGYTLEEHSTNTTSLSKIALGDWDFVILQEQSQRPSFTDAEVIADVFPYARKLDSLININNPCAETMFYMTWGRKNGDASNCAVWPPVCTYEGMDSLLYLRYMMMTFDNDAAVSPVGAVWHYIRDNYPAIELYSVDESHPSQAGSYAAACCFYTAMFRSTPLNITYDYTLSASDASDIRTAVKVVVFDSLAKWNIGTMDPSADFSFVEDLNNEVHFTNLSTWARSWDWNFGDGNSSDLENPSHTYAAPGAYTVTLTAGCLYNDSIQKTVNPIVGVDEFSDENYSVFPNPANNKIIISANVGSIVELHSFDGKRVQRFEMTESETEISVKGLETGLYLVKVDSHCTKLFIE